MSEREELAAGMSGERCPDGGLHTPNWQDSAWVCLDCGVALVVAELRAHDDRIRAEALVPVLALADEWDAMFPEAGRWHRHAADSIRDRVASCEHRDSLTGVDQVHGNEPEKVWRCDTCGTAGTRSALRADDDPHRLARDYLDRLRTTDPSARVLAVIDRLKADMARACEVCDECEEER